MPPGPVFCQRMQFEIVDVPLVLMMQPASVVALLPENVESRMVQALLVPIHTAPPPLEPVALLPLKTQLVIFVADEP